MGFLLVRYVPYNVHSSSQMVTIFEVSKHGSTEHMGQITKTQVFALNEIIRVP